MGARRWPIREELYIHYCESSNSQYIEGPHQKLFFHLQESEDRRRARLDEQI